MAASIPIPNSVRQVPMEARGITQRSEAQQRPRSDLTGFLSLKEKFAAAPQARLRKPRVSEPLRSSVGFDALGTAVDATSFVARSPSYTGRRFMMEEFASVDEVQAARLASVDEVQAARLAQLRDELEASSEGKHPCCCFKDLTPRCLTQF